MAKYISKLINGEELYYLKDSEARENKADKNATVSTVSYDATNKKITKTINGVTSDVVTAERLVTDGGAAIESDVYTRAQTDAMLETKVDKVTGKGLSTNDFDNTSKGKLDDLPSTSEAAESGGTDLSLVTTGEKYNWNAKYALPSGGTSSQFIKADGSTDSTEYLPLSGGTMNGTIYGNTGSGLVVQSNNNSAYGQGIRIVASSNTDHWAVLSLQNSNTQDNLALAFNETSKSKSIDMLENGTSKSLTIPYEDGRLLHTGDNSFGTLNSGDILSLLTTADHVSMVYKCKNNTIWSVGSNSTYGFTYWNSSASAVVFNIKDNGFVGIGKINPSYKLHVNGEVGATNYNNTSDIRKKDIIENVSLNVEDVANAPLFKFSWLDPEMPEGVNVGTSAQYWQTIIPEIVSEANDDEKALSMQYGVAGLASSITLARKVVEQENTIKAQEARIKALEDAIAEIQNKLK